MRFGVLGTGTVGRTIAGKLSSLHHDIAMGTRDPDATLSRTDGDQPIRQWLDVHEGIRLLPFDEAAAFGEAVVNTTTGTASLSALTAAGNTNLAGKVLIDVANPLVSSGGMPPSLDPANTDSLGEQIQRTFPEARVVKSLNTMNAAIMVEPSRIAGDHNVFVSGNEEAAKRFVTDLLADFGWPPRNIIDLGDITTARGAEMLLPMWVRLYGTLGHLSFNFHIQGA